MVEIQVPCLSYEKQLFTNSIFTSNLMFNVFIMQTVLSSASS